MKVVGPIQRETIQAPIESGTVFTQPVSKHLCGGVGIWERKMHRTCRGAFFPLVKPMGLLTCYERSRKEVLPRPAGRLRLSSTRTLVSGSGAFYNTGNTRAAAVLSFTRGPGTQPPFKPDALSASGCLKIEPYFGISQEH